jgi:hypothetical protein
LGIDADSIVADTDRELCRLERYLGFDPSRSRVSEGVSYRLARYPVDLVVNRRLQDPGTARDENLIARFRLATAGGKLLPQRGQRFSQSGASRRRFTQAANGHPSFEERLIASGERGIEHFHRFERMLGQQLPHCLQPEHEPLDSLKQ